MDGTGNQKDALQDKTGQTSADEKETSKDTEAKTYNEDELNTAVAKAKSDALATAGRTATALEQREAAVKAIEDTNKAEQERRDAAELAEAQKDPDRLAVYQSKQAERQRTKKQDERDAAQDKREAEHEAEINAAKEAQKEITIWQVASAKNIDPVRLKNLSEKFNVEGKEKLEELAGEIASGKPEDETPDKKKTHDSLVTSGRSKDLSGKSPMELAQEAYKK